jgi:uncharacterized protein YlxP (DUF503 family)
MKEKQRKEKKPRQSTKTAVATRTIGIPPCDEEILDSIITKLSEHYNVAIVAKVKQTGVFRKKLIYSITISGPAKRVKQCDDNLLYLANEHNNEPPEVVTETVSGIPLWVGEPSLF